MSKFVEFNESVVDGDYQTRIIPIERIREVKRNKDDSADILITTAYGADWCRTSYYSLIRDQLIG